MAKRTTIEKRRLKALQQLNTVGISKYEQKRINALKTANTEPEKSKLEIACIGVSTSLKEVAHAIAEANAAGNTFVQVCENIKAK